MVSRLRRINALQFALISAIIYAVIALIVSIPVALISMTASTASKEMVPMLFVGPMMIVIAPIMYGAIGFIGGIIFAALYNLVAGWTGGVEITLETVPAFTPTI